MLSMSGSTSCFGSVDSVYNECSSQPIGGFSGAYISHARMQAMPRRRTLPDSSERHARWQQSVGKGAGSYGTGVIAASAIGMLNGSHQMTSHE